jgi:hypothetical protein
VGGVSGRAGAKAGGSNPSASRHESFACRDGQRHPGLPEGGALRGASSERGPRSVRRPQRVSSRGGGRADDSGCPKGAKEGNAVSVRHQAYAPAAGTRDRRMRARDASFARSFDPCTSILTMLRGRKPLEVGHPQSPAAARGEATRPERWSSRSQACRPKTGAPGSRGNPRAPQVTTRCQFR